jgi:SAM-dependent methyltransferase
MKGKVLEVGSRDICGNPRNHFPTDRFPFYVGVDMLAGQNVDLVLNAHELTSRFQGTYFDVVITVEMIEHDDNFWVSFLEMGRVLKPGGYMIVTTRSWRGCSPHDCPNDYWRFMLEGLKRCLDLAGVEYLEGVDCEADGGVFACGRKR